MRFVTPQVSSFHRDYLFSRKYFHCKICGWLRGLYFWKEVSSIRLYYWRCHSGQMRIYFLIWVNWPFNNRGRRMKTLCKTQIKTSKHTSCSLSVSIHFQKHCLDTQSIPLFSIFNHMSHFFSATVLNVVAQSESAICYQPAHWRRSDTLFRDSNQELWDWNSECCGPSMSLDCSSSFTAKTAE